MSNFPSKVNVFQAPAVVGDFASQNPRASMLAGQGDLVAPVGGLIVGNFAFVTKNVTNDTVSQAWASGTEVGFLAREQQGLITTFLAGDSLVVPQGFMVTLYTEGDFYGLFQGGATPGQNVYADESDGSLISAASAPAAASATGLIGSNNTVAGSITAGVLTITTAATAGSVMPGDTFTATGVPAVAHNGASVTIGSQLTGTTGGIGTYQLAAPDSAITVAAFTNGQSLTSSYATFSAVGTGTLVPGANLKSALLVANTILGAQITGTAGAAGIYAISPNQAAIASGTITTLAAIATGFIVRSAAAAGFLAKISTWG